MEKIKKKNLFEELKNEFIRNNYTLIGNYVGLKLIKYQEKIIIFHSIVENYSNESSLNITYNSFFFKRFGLNYIPEEKVSENIESFVTFAMLLKQVYQEVSSSHIANEEEGSVKTS